VSPGRGNYETFVSISDPDGNGWLVQEVGYRASWRAAAQDRRSDGRGL